MFSFERKTSFLPSNTKLIPIFLCFQEVVDESDGCGGKFSAVIVSPQFEGKALLQRHRLVNGALSEELKTIHAFSQKTFTPKQWEDAKQ